jgi:hypothetical protein
MEIRLKNEDFTMFKDNAKTALENHVAEYAQELKDEAERVAIPQFQNKEDAIVYESTVNSVIGLRGHHVFKKTNTFFTYILPCVDAILGSLFVSMLCVDNKKWWHGAIIGVSFALIIGSIVLRHYHDPNK